MYENDGPLIRLARGASMRPSDPERKEQSCSGNAKSLLGDQVPCGSFGHPLVLDHRSLSAFQIAWSWLKNALVGVRATRSSNDFLYAPSS